MKSPSKVDIRGREIEVGQTIAVAFRVGNHSELRLGVVESIRLEDREYYRVEFKAKVNWLTGRVKNSEIGLDSTRIAVVV